MLTLNDMFYISGTRSFKRDSDDAEGDYGSKNIKMCIRDRLYTVQVITQPVNGGA